MSGFTSRNPDFAERVRKSFASQTMMATLGASLGRVEPGLVEIAMPFSGGILQQNGFVHGGALTTIADSAAGYAAFTLVPDGQGVLTVEMKINFLAPAALPSYVAIGQVRRAGRTLTICQTDIYGLQDGGGRVAVGLLTATMMVVDARGSV